MIFPGAVAIGCAAGARPQLWCRLAAKILGGHGEWAGPAPVERSSASNGHRDASRVPTRPRWPRDMRCEPGAVIAQVLS